MTDHTATVRNIYATFGSGKAVSFQQHTDTALHLRAMQ